MDNQYGEFRAGVPYNFKELMIEYWMRDENMDKNEAMNAYLTGDFFRLERRIAGTVRTFKPDLGYSDSMINGTLCFEVEDNNVVIPIEILIEI